MANVAFPSALTLDVPFPTERLATTAQRAIDVDPELSPLVRRTLRVLGQDADAEGAVLRVEYAATTNRMLRVAVNTFMDSLRLVVEVMERLDVDVLAAGSGAIQST